MADLDQIRLHQSFLSKPEDIIDEARKGRRFILVDDEDRENEGDLIIAAQMATPDLVNFMAKHGRGPILAMTTARSEQLGLDQMSRNNQTRQETAFTVSIEARDGVATGLSAADRARTITVAIDGARGPEYIEKADLEQLRDYGVGAQVLAELSVHEMILLTNSHRNLAALGGYGPSIVGERKISNDHGTN